MFCMAADFRGGDAVLRESHAERGGGQRGGVHRLPPPGEWPPAGGSRPTSRARCRHLPAMQEEISPGRVDQVPGGYFWP